MQKLLMTYFSFVIACVAVIATFITATTYTQLTVAILLYPVLVFFAYRALPLKRRKAFTETSLSEMKPPPAAEIESQPEVNFGKGIGISDIDKRVFLKLIGGAGVFLFLYSIFNKKAEGLFFKNLPAGGAIAGKVALEDTSGNKIDPAQNHPTDGYNICEVEDDVVSFYGYTNKAGAWYVMKVETTTGSFRYSRGDSNFPSNWNGRENLKYDYYSNTF